MAIDSLRGLTRLGSGREAEIYSLSDDRVLRLARDRSATGLVELEFRALTAAHAAGAPVPAAYELVTVEGRPGLVMQRLDGEDQLSKLNSRPWLVFAAARALGSVHAALHEVRAPDEMPRLHDVIEERMASELVPAQIVESAKGRLTQLPDGDRLYHGDFHPANLLQGPDGYAVIDWANGARGDPAADVARTRLLVETADVAMEEVSVVTRRLDRIGRRILLRGHASGYARERPLDRALVERWLPVCAAARLAEDVAPERERLLAIARERLA